MAETELKIRARTYDPRTVFGLIGEAMHPLLAKILASRGITRKDQLGASLSSLLHYSQLKDAKEAAVILADGIQAKRKFLVVADYDCDGATACAVALRGLKAFGAQVDFIVPDRMIHGYGLTPSVVELAMTRFPDTEILVTVDNGVASHAGVEAAIAKGLDVVVTDHHLASKIKPLPPALVVVNPNQPACSFPSKALAGCGVIWYVLWALQDEFKKRGWAPAQEGFKVSQLLPLVAVGTVADVVPLDLNNRTLVTNGLQRIHAGVGFPGVEALATVGVINHTDPRELVTTDIGFGIGPRINAAGRLETMDIGIACLMEDDHEKAQAMATQLDDINSARKNLEYGIVLEAVAQAEALIEGDAGAIVVHADEWHAGVIGIVAGRIKESRYRPTFVLMTDPDTGEHKGSGRSIPGFNLKDALDQVDKMCPGLMPKFGGHAMAAGVTLRPGGVEQFRKAFEEEATRMLTPEVLAQQVEHDGSLSVLELTVPVAKKLRGPTWGQLFPEPSFCDVFNVVEAKMAGQHKDQLNMVVDREGLQLKAVRYRFAGEVPTGMVRLVYKLAITKRKGKEELKLMVDHVIPL